MRQYFVGAPMERVAIDIFGPLPRTKAGKIYILIVCDYFTRWTEGFPLTNIEASTVAQTLVFQFICRFGVPRQAHTDQGGLVSPVKSILTKALSSSLTCSKKFANY